MDEEFGLVVFRSRQHAIRFQNFLQREGVAASLVSTPEKVSIGCGVSVRVNVRDLPRVSRLMTAGDRETVSGIYHVSYHGCRPTFSVFL